MNKLSEFKGYTKHWLNKLGIGHIEARFERGCSKDANAEVEYDEDSMIATFSLAKRLHKDVSINRLSIHECIHVMMTPYEEALKRGDFDKAIEEEHKIIGNLINLLLKE